MGVSIAKSAGPVNVAYEAFVVDLLNQTAGFSRGYRPSLTEKVFCRFNAYIRANRAGDLLTPVNLKVWASDGQTDPQIYTTSSDGVGCGNVSGCFLTSPLSNIIYEVTPASVTDPYNFDLHLVIEVL